MDIGFSVNDGQGEDPDDHVEIEDEDTALASVR